MMSSQLRRGHWLPPPADRGTCFRVGPASNPPPRATVDSQVQFARTHEAPGRRDVMDLSCAGLGLHSACGHGRESAVAWDGENSTRAGGDAPHQSTGRNASPRSVHPTGVKLHSRGRGAKGRLWPWKASKREMGRAYAPWPASHSRFVRIIKHYQPTHR